jgi:succinate dehydrogenase / fumarate reductase flavoprotein subunit
MQGLADGYFVIPYTIGGYLSGVTPGKTPASAPAFKDAAKKCENRTKRLLSINGKKTVDDFHKRLGLILWDYCGMSRNEQGLIKAKGMIAELREEFYQNVLVPGADKDLNQSLERAGRVADFLEFGELMISDALNRKESCGGHFNEAFQTEEGEALRDDENFCYVSAWEFTGDGKEPALHKEPLEFENVKLTQRSYK